MAGRAHIVFFWVSPERSRCSPRRTLSSTSTATCPIGMIGCSIRKNMKARAERAGLTRYLGAAPQSYTYYHTADHSYEAENQSRFLAKA